MTVGSASGVPNAPLGCLGSCTFWQAALHGAQLTSPVNGTVVSWTVLTTSQGTARLRVLNRLDAISASFLSSGPFQPVAPGTNRLPASLPISIGNEIGVEGGNATQISEVTFFSRNDSTPGASIRVFDPSPPDGGNGSSDEIPDMRIFVEAEVQPTNLVAVSSLTRKRNGSALLTATLPNAGSLTVAGTTRRTAAAAAKRVAYIKPLTLSASGPGPVTLGLRPTKRTKSVLKKKGKAKGIVNLTFTPNLGSAGTTPVKVKLRLRRPRR